jgi:hypothetical protein
MVTAAHSVRTATPTRRTKVEGWDAVEAMADRVGCPA